MQTRPVVDYSLLEMNEVDGHLQDEAAQVAATAEHVVEALLGHVACALAGQRQVGELKIKIKKN
jgi:hypothetical protein